LKIHVGDSLTVLRKMPSSSVDCVVTSPPYWGLRDYQTAKWRGGDPGCDHRKVSDVVKAIATSTLGGGKKTTGHLQEGFKSTCGKCGATRIDKQIGLEKTPDDFVSALADVFDEVYRVLKPTGNLWLNLGDSYATGAGKAHSPGGGSQGTNWKGTATQANRMPLPGLKPKDLIGIPWRVAFELQKRGWYLRSDIIWHKPNPMPESVTDRPTKAHEYLFLLTKRERYFYDHEAVKEAVADRTSLYMQRYGDVHYERKLDSGRNDSKTATAYTLGGANGTRNKRTVWTVSTKPYKGAHFATFPPKLIEPCILAGCPKGGLVLDPFAGACTTAVVALEHGRDFIGIELNPAYVELGKRRIAEATRQPQRLAA
jgi:DNA modification methylase